MMPVIDGRNFRTALIAKPRTASILVAMMTADVAAAPSLGYAA